MTNRDQENELLTWQTYAKTYSHIISHLQTFSAKIFSISKTKRTRKIKIILYYDSAV